MAIVDKWEGKEMIDKGFSIVVACRILFLIGIGVSITYAQEQFGNMTSTYGNMTEFEYVDAIYHLICCLVPLFIVIVTRSMQV